MILFLVISVGWFAGAPAADGPHEQSPTPAPATPVVIGRIAQVTVEAGTTFRVRIPVQVATGYHVQANPASTEFLVPVEVSIGDSDSLSFGTPTYPEAEMYRLEGTEDDLRTYSGTFEIVVPVSANESARPGARNVNAVLRYQACSSRTCLFPASASIEIRCVVTESEGNEDPQ